MANTNDRSAFPRPASGPVDCDGFPLHPSAPGMTLREWYAGLAMQGTAAAWRTSEPVSPETLARAARGCVMMADALLAALAEP